MKKISLTFIIIITGGYISAQWAEKGTNLATSVGTKWLPCYPILGFDRLSLIIRLLNGILDCQIEYIKNRLP